MILTDPRDIQVGARVSYEGEEPANWLAVWRNGNEPRYIRRGDLGTVYLTPDQQVAVKWDRYEDRPGWYCRITHKTPVKLVDFVDLPAPLFDTPLKRSN